MFTFSLIEKADKNKLNQQLSNIRNDLIDNCNSKTIESTANELFTYYDDKVKIFGKAFKSEIIEMAGVNENNLFTLSNSNFCI